MFLARRKKPTVTADSVTVAEFIAYHLYSHRTHFHPPRCEGDYVDAEIGHPQLEFTILGENNISTIAMTNNDFNGQMTKHIEIRFTLIRE